eukprot:948881_1
MIGMPMMRMRRRRRIIGTALVASAVVNNNQRRRHEYEYQSQQQAQLAAQQREIDRLKSEQRARRKAEESQPKIVYVQAPPLGYTAQHVQKVSGVQQIEYVQQHQQQPILTKPKSNILYVQKEGVYVSSQNPNIGTIPAYNPEVHPLVPAQQQPNIQYHKPVQTAATVQTINRQLTQEQHYYVQPKPK